MNKQDQNGKFSSNQQAAARQALPERLLQRLFTRCKLTFQAGALEHACQHVNLHKSPLSPLDRLRQILTKMQISQVQCAQMHWFRFDQRRLPAMVFHEQQWWYCETAEDNAVQLEDPQGNKQSVSEERLVDALVLWLDAPPTGPDQSLQDLRRSPATRLVFRELFRDRRWVFEIILATVIINILAVSTSVFAMQVYDRVVPTLAYATLWTLVAGMGIIILLDWLLKRVRARILDSVASVTDQQVSQHIYEHILKLRLDNAPRSLGSLAAQVNGLEGARQFFSSGIVFMIADMPFALMFIGFIAFIGGPVAWVYIILLPVAILIGVISQRRIRQLIRHQIKSHNERQGLLVDSIRGAESIRASNAGWRFAQNWKTITAFVNASAIQQKDITSSATVSTGSLSSLAYISALVVGVGQIAAGNLTMGGLIACSILGGRVIQPVARATQFLSQWENVSQGLQMVNQVLQQDTERKPSQALMMPDNPPDRLEIQDLRFAYPGMPVQQLQIPCLDFQAGERIMLIGGVGSGKSTLLKVLAGLYKPGEGRVRLGDADLWETAPCHVASHVGYLPQTVHLFKGTLRSNLLISGAVSDSRLLQVCGDLGLAQIAADSPLGMDLPISEGGDGLSGGQRQLVALGRLMVTSPCIWLLDEPTAGLDNKTEARLLDTLQQYLKPDDILILATHRPWVASRIATRTLVMRKGEIVEDGSTETVLSNLNPGRQGATSPRIPNQYSQGNTIKEGKRGPFNVI